MAILKIKEAGEEVTLQIKTAEIVEGQYGEQVKFADVNGDVLYVPVDSVRRQLDRCHVADIEDLSGKTVHFARAANHKKPGQCFWNLDAARDGDAVHTNAPAPHTNGKAPVASAMTPKHEVKDVGRLPGDEFNLFDEQVEKYAECVSTAKALWAGSTDDAIVAAAATLYIQRMKSNV